jgi:hypothetical protein
MACLPDIPLEIFPIIAEDLPLYAKPQVLLAFSLTSRTFSTIFLPLFWSHLVLKNVTHALSVLHKMLSNPCQGLLVRGLYIQWEPSPKALQAAPDSTDIALDVIRALERVVMSGSVPLLKALELHMENPGWWYVGGRGEPWDISRFGELRAPFWEGLRLHCPKLHTLSLSNIRGPVDDLWPKETGILHVQVCHVRYHCRGKTH